MDIKKIIAGLAAGSLFVLCFVRDIKVEDAAKELIKAEVQEKISDTKARVDSVKSEAIKKNKKKIKLFKRLVPKKEAK
tara:strand:- start:141 stop:374 length:234 start_codon:yes stop_codon:yes gene_type:complete